MAEALVQHGASVTISSSNQSRVEDAVTNLQKQYESASSLIAGYKCDLSNATSAENEIEALFRETGKLEHIVFTAGDSLAMVPIHDMSQELAQTAGQLRFFAPLLVAKHAAQYLSDGPRSSIVFTAGIVSERPIPGWPLVSAYAAAMHGLVRALAVDLKPVRVNVVSPGVVDTDIYARSGIPDEVKQGILAETKQKLPIGKIPTPADVAEAYIYLLKNESATGEVVHANGGHLLV